MSITTMTTRIITTHEKQILKRLRKRAPKSLHDLAEEIGHGTSVHSLTGAIGLLVSEGEAVKHSGRPPTYTRA